MVVVITRIEDHSPAVVGFAAAWFSSGDFGEYESAKSENKHAERGLRARSV